MKTQLAVLTFVLGTRFLFAAEEPDLTGAGATSFKGHLGKIVTLRGRLEVGKEGYCLWRAAPTDVAFYIIPDMPHSGRYSYPASWQLLLHNQVSVTGELKFRSFHRPQAASVKKGTAQEPPDYYYMVLQRSRIKQAAKPPARPRG